MALHRLDATQVLPVGLDQAWAFFFGPRNLVRITYRLRPLLGICAQWVTEIPTVEERTCR